MTCRARMSSLSPLRWSCHMCATCLLERRRPARDAAARRRRGPRRRADEAAPLLASGARWVLVVAHVISGGCWCWQWSSWQPCTSLRVYLRPSAPLVRRLLLRAGSSYAPQGRSMECPIDLAAAAANDGGGGGDRGARLSKLRRGLLVEAISVGLTVCVKFNVVRVPMPASLKSQL